MHVIVDLHYSERRGVLFRENKKCFFLSLEEAKRVKKETGVSLSGDRPKNNLWKSFGTSVRKYLRCIKGVHLVQVAWPNGLFQSLRKIVILFRLYPPLHVI